MKIVSFYLERLRWYDHKFEVCCFFSSHPVYVAWGHSSEKHTRDKHVQSCTHKQRVINDTMLWASIHDVIEPTQYKINAYIVNY